MLVFLLWGCGSSLPSKLTQVKMNMSKTEITEMLGNTGEMKSSTKDPDGKIREIWIYSYCNDLLCENKSNFELYFLDDRLVKVQRK